MMDASGEEFVEWSVVTDLTKVSGVKVTDDIFWEVLICADA